MSLKYLAASVHDPAHSANFQKAVPEIEALDGKIGADISETISFKSETTPTTQFIDGKELQIRNLEANSSRAGDYTLSFVYVVDENGVGDFITVDH